MLSWSLARKKSPMANKDKAVRVPVGRNLWSFHRDLEQATPESTTMRVAEKRDARRRISQSGGYILFLICVFLVSMQAGFFASNNPPRSDSYPQESDVGPSWLSQPSNTLFSDARSKNAIKEHPISKLMEEAEAKYRKKLGGQSKTLRAAVAEYKRRYRRSPPRGFGEWWAFAQAHDVKMVDEYDSLMDDLAPFWELSGQEIRRRALQVSLPA